jgi:hypothetical protein
MGRGLGVLWCGGDEGDSACIGEMEVSGCLTRAKVSEMMNSEDRK